MYVFVRARTYLEAWMGVGADRSRYSLRIEFILRDSRSMIPPPRLLLHDSPPLFLLQDSSSVIPPP